MLIYELPLNLTDYLFRIVARGDSQSAAITQTGNRPSELWLPQLCRRINMEGGSVLGQTFAYTGYTTSQILGEKFPLTHHYPGMPKRAIGVIFCGNNDFNQTETGTCPTNAPNNKTIYLKAYGPLATDGKNVVNSWYGNTITKVTAGVSESNTIIGFYYDSTNNRGVATVLNAWTTLPTSTTTYTIDASTEANTKANIMAGIKADKYGVRGSFTGGVTLHEQAMLPANGYPGQRFVIMKDSSTNGGVKEGNYIGQHPTITTNTSASPIQSVWEFRNYQPGEAGWGRVAVLGTAPFADGIDKIVVVSCEYKNYSTGGDNYGASTEYAPYIPLRRAQKEAAEAEGVAFANVYEYQKWTLYGGNYVASDPTHKQTLIAKIQNQGEFKMFIADNNSHYNKLGHQMVQECIYQELKAWGWLDLMMN